MEVEGTDGIFRREGRRVNAMRGKGGGDGGEQGCGGVGGDEKGRQVSVRR